MIRIIIVTYNACGELERCINSILNTDAGAPYVITVYNNNSTDHTSLWLKENAAHNFEYHNLEQNYGFSKAANIAAQNSSEDLLVFLDDDVVVVDQWLYRLKRTIKSSPTTGLVGCRFLDSQSRIYYAETRCGPLRTLRRHELDCGQGIYCKQTDVVVGACWMVQREAFEKIGGLDENFFPAQFEDIDFCLRLRLAGYQIIYQGELTLTHTNLHRSGGRGSHLANRTYFYNKWKDSLASFPRHDSHPVDILASEAIRFIQNDQCNRALTACEKIQAMDSAYHEPLIEYWALLKAGLTERASSIANELLRLNPENIFVRLQMISNSNSPLAEEQKNIHASRLLDVLEHRMRSGISETQTQVKR